MPSMERINIFLFTVIGLLVMTIIATYGYDGYKRLRAHPVEDVELNNMVNLLTPTSVPMLVEMAEIPKST